MASQEDDIKEKTQRHHDSMENQTALVLKKAEINDLQAHLEQEAPLPEIDLLAEEDLEDFKHLEDDSDVDDQGEIDDLPVILKNEPDQDELSFYLSQIRQYPLLTREEEQKLTQHYFQKQDQRTAKKLVTSNLRLVVKIAMEYRRNWVSMIDLIQEGNLGLMEAVKRFDPYRGVRFSSFARYWIRALILQYILKNFRMVSFSNTRAGRKLFFRLEKERAKLIALYGEATTKQLALNLGVDEADVEIANALKHAPISLSEPRWSGDQDGPSFADTLEDKGASPETQVIQNEFQGLLFKHMKAFEQTIDNERDLVIWHERLISEDPIALSELGDRFHISRERVRQLENRIKKRLELYLRENLGEEFIIGIQNGSQKD
jgi:RNA polymerase sigma-32 factor